MCSVCAPQNSPDELLEVFDASGIPTGRAKPRAAIHLDGDWHQAFHCWIVRGRGRRREIVLQRRSELKDTFPGVWDAAAAGHWRFGESAEQAAREITEELGVHVSFESLRYRGRERAARVFPNGVIDREHHQVYVLESSAPLSTYRPDPNEVIGLATFPAYTLVELVRGGCAQVEATEAVTVNRDGRLRATHVVLTHEQLVPYSAARLRRVLGRGEANW
jgi:isopentenyldiphosphate isomerase